MFVRNERYVLTVEPEMHEAICEALLKLYNRLIKKGSVYTAADILAHHNKFVSTPKQNQGATITLENVTARNEILNAVYENYLAVKEEGKHEEVNRLAVLYKRILKCPTEREHHKNQRGAAQRAGAR